MLNKAMERMLKAGDAIDVSKCERTEDGFYILKSFSFADGGYCDAGTEQWIQSIGRQKSTGDIFASTGTIFHQNPDYECLWFEDGIERRLAK